MPRARSARHYDVYTGDANAAGEDNRNVARMAVLLGGLLVSVPGVTVNRLCGSGMEAAAQVARMIAVGDASICLAGGVESMSRARWVMVKPESGFARDNATLSSNPRLADGQSEMPVDWIVSLGETAELLADRGAITREAQDAFALRSDQRATAAIDAGAFTDEIVAVPDVDLMHAENTRSTTSPRGLPASVLCSGRTRAR